MNNQYENHIRKTLDKYGNVVVSKKKFKSLSKYLQDKLNNAIGKHESKRTVFYDLKFEIEGAKKPKKLPLRKIIFKEVV